MDSWKLWKFGNWKVNISRSPKYENISNVLLSHKYFRKLVICWCIFLKCWYPQNDRAFPGFAVKKTNFKLWILDFRKSQKSKKSLRNPKYEHTRTPHYIKNNLDKSRNPRIYYKNVSLPLNIPTPTPAPDWSGPVAWVIAPVEVQQLDAYRTWHFNSMPTLRYI